jgi:hypothetical protein
MMIDFEAANMNEILKQRRTLLRQNRSIELENTRIDRNKTIKITSQEEPNESRDYITPDVDPIAMEALKKVILEQLNKSVTKRKKMTEKSDGTPVATKTKLKTSIPVQSPTSNNNDNCQQPRRLCHVLRHIKTSADSEKDNEQDIVFPEFSEGLKKILKRQYYIHPDLMEFVFFAEKNMNIDAKELFPFSSPERLARRRSTVWDDN